MLSLKKQNITKWIVFLPAFAILLTFLITLAIVISAERAEYYKSLETARIAYVKRSKAQAQERIDKLIEYINENEKLWKCEFCEEVNILNHFVKEEKPTEECIDYFIDNKKKTTPDIKTINNA